MNLEYVIEDAFEFQPESFDSEVLELLAAFR